MKKLQKKVLSVTLAAAVLFTSVCHFDKNVNAKSAQSLSRYSMEGYATVQNVTGGGVLQETDTDYYKAATASDFLKALTDAKKRKKPAVIEVTSDLALGSIEIGSALTTYKGVVTAVSNKPLLHPTLIETGVSMINIKDMSDLTIYSKNGSKITHACFNLARAKNVIFRNLIFDEIWEWDEATSGDYDRNDWDYITAQNETTGLWIDHCTFYKAYDGIVDVKKASAANTSDVTISYSKFLPGSEGSFFDDMMKKLESEPTKYPYYNSLVTTYGMTKDQVRGYANAQKKTHLIGASDSEANTKNLRITLANNYYKNSMDRMPRIRAGYAHVYNCIMDSSELYTLRNGIKNSKAKSKIVSNGSVSTCKANVLLQNDKVDGILYTLLSGNGSSPAGYVGAKDCSYTLGGQTKKLEVVDKTGEGLILDTKAFLSGLPYAPVLLQEADHLTETVLPYAGAGILDLTKEQWMQTSYVDAPEATPEITPVPTPEATPVPTPEVTPVPTPEVTPVPTPEVTPVPTPEATPEVTPVPTPEVTPVSAYVHNFTKDQLASEYYEMKGSLSSSKGTVVFEGLTLTTALKMESSTKIAFTASKEQTLTLVANVDCNKSILINGEKYSFKNGILTVKVSAGNHVITKEDSNVNIYYVAVK